MSSSSKTNNEQQLSHLQTRAAIDKERRNEGKYQSMYKDLLKKYQSLDLMKAAETCPNPQDYAAESKVLKKAMEIERDIMIGGIVVGLTAFFSVRYLPRVAVRLIGGEAKVQALRKAEEASKKAPGAFLRRAGAFLFEGTFGFWAGWRGYNMGASLQSEDVYEGLTKIPLCEGRSFVSEAACDEWIDLTYKKIPPEFWKNLDEEETNEHKLEETDMWNAIRSFAGNCIKRRLYENILREHKAFKENQLVIPSPGVPENFDALSKEEAEAIVDNALKQ